MAKSASRAANLASIAANFEESDSEVDVTGGGGIVASEVSGIGVGSGEGTRPSIIIGAEEIVGIIGGEIVAVVVAEEVKRTRDLRGYREPLSSSEGVYSSSSSSPICLLPREDSPCKPDDLTTNRLP